MTVQLIRNAPDSLRYEHQLIVAQGDYVIVDRGFSGTGRPVAWVTADIVRIENGRLSRTLGRLTRRGDKSRIEERPADVWRSLRRLNELFRTFCSFSRRVTTESRLADRMKCFTGSVSDSLRQISLQSLGLPQQAAL